MQQQIVFQTIKNWIQSCRTVEQLAVTHDAVINLYDNVYHAAGTPNSEELHKACIQRKVDMDAQNEELNFIETVHIMD